MGEVKRETETRVEAGRGVGEGAWVGGVGWGKGGRRDRRL